MSRYFFRYCVPHSEVRNIREWAAIVKTHMSAGEYFAGYVDLNTAKIRYLHVMRQNFLRLAEDFRCLTEPGYSCEGGYFGVVIATDAIDFVIVYLGGSGEISIEKKEDILKWMNLKH